MVSVSSLIVYTHFFYKKLLFQKRKLNLLPNYNINTKAGCSHNNKEQKSKKLLLVILVKIPVHIFMKFPV